MTPASDWSGTLRPSRSKRCAATGGQPGPAHSRSRIVSGSGTCALSRRRPPRAAAARAQVALHRHMEKSAREFAEWKRQRDKELLQLKKQGRVNAAQMQKLEALHVKQQAVLRRKTGAPGGSAAACEMRNPRRPQPGDGQCTGWGATSLARRPRLWPTEEAEAARKRLKEMEERRRGVVPSRPATAAPAAGPAHSERPITAPASAASSSAAREPFVAAVERSAASMSAAPSVECQPNPHAPLLRGATVGCRPACQLSAKCSVPGLPAWPATTCQPPADSLCLGVCRREEPARLGGARAGRLLRLLRAAGEGKGAGQGRWQPCRQAFGCQFLAGALTWRDGLLPPPARSACWRARRRCDQRRRGTFARWRPAWRPRRTPPGSRPQCRAPASGFRAAAGCLCRVLRLCLPARLAAQVRSSEGARSPFPTRACHPLRAA